MAIKKTVKNNSNKKKKHNKIIMLARSKLNSVKSKVSEALINNEMKKERKKEMKKKEERNYRELKESIRMMKGQEDKKIDTD